VMENPEVAEVAAVGIPHELKGESVYCFVVLKQQDDSLEERRQEIHQHLTHSLGKALAPEKILFVESLPKTRSGKILRGIIRKLILKEPVDPANTENPQSLDHIRQAS